MTRNIAPKALAAIFATTLATTGFAQANTGLNTGVDADVEAGVSTEAPAKKGNMSAEAGASAMTYGQVIASLNNPTWDSAGLQAVSDASAVKTLRLSELKGEGAENAQSLDNALVTAESDLQALHDAIGASDVLSQKVEEEGFEADDVVAAQTEADGSITLIIDDRA